MRNRVGRRDKRVWFVVLGIFVTIFLFSFLVNRFKTMRENADAASLANFNPGYIISDYQMSNYNSMTEAEIQAFLTGKNPCGNTDYNYYLQLSANTNYKWHFEDGHFVCLSEELFGDGEVIGSGDTAAHIIWQAAQDYKINPQVLIVLIQKETALITDTIPNDGDYRKATGFGCPDTAACSSDYYGFKNQVRNAAKLFREVLDGGWTNYPIGNNYIQYNPNASCGGSVVNIQNLATSALYRYTPYQPNDAALTAGYGEAVCGAYGNRNFYLYFEDWFGGILEDRKWQDMLIPRNMVVETDTMKINPIEGTIYNEQEANAGEKYYFVSKIDITWGGVQETCLRTVVDTMNGMNIGTAANASFQVPVTDNIAIELAQGNNIGDLENRWEGIRAKNKDLLQGYNPYFSIDAMAEGGAPELFRLRIGPVQDVRTGDALCDKLSRRGITCSVIRTQ